MVNDFDQNIEIRIRDFLHKNFGNEVFKPGLERTINIFEPFVGIFKSRGVKVITIGGTNGKGQTAHTLAELFTNSQQEYGMWTSPHILSIRERFNFGKDIRYSELEEEISESYQHGATLSYYEFLFYIFLKLSLKRNNIKYLILEVGLGGRLDAVNHFHADCAVISSISRDHQAILGNTYREILLEKIAIAREGKPLFTSFHLDYLNDLTINYCKNNSISWKPQGICKDYFLSNKNLAKEIFKYFEPDSLVGEAAHFPTFKGRHEEMTFKGNTLIFIGAHNVEGIRKMVEHFSLENNFNKLDVILFSFSKRPIIEIKIMLKILTEFSKNKISMWPTFFSHPKAIERDLIESSSKEFILDWKLQLEQYSKINQEKKILVCGSYYFIGEVQCHILDDSSRSRDQRNV